ncbi:MAG: hypothetical protein M0P61_10065 [Ignavibacteriaceae bacterium]|nr:hypothetical protein [Ignavibacteriaceae bacterium]
MIVVSIYVKEEKLFIQVKHKIVYQVEKEFLNKKNQHFRSLLLFTHLFVSIIKLGFKELFQLRKTGKLVSEISAVPVNYIEEK